MYSFQQKTQSGEGEIQVSEILAILTRYKLSIIVIALSITLLSGVIAYLSPDIYRATTTFDITSRQGGGVRGDVLSMAMGRSGSDIESDIAMLSSTFLAKKALQNLNLGTRYFTEKHYRTHELYKSSPFVVATRYLSPKATGVRFQLTPVDGDRFRLTIEPTLKVEISNYIRSLFSDIPETDHLLRYDEAHSFDAPISTPWFEIEVKKVHKLQKQPYFFSIVPNRKLAYLIGSGLTVMEVGGAIVKVDYEDEVASRAKEVLDAVIEAYEEENLIQKTKIASNKLNFIDEQLEIIDSSLKLSSKDLRRYQTKHVTVPLGKKSDIASGKISEYETEIDELNIQIDLFENALTYIKSGGDLQNINLGNTPNTQAVNGLINQIIESAEEQAVLLLDFTELHPDVIRITETLRKLEERLLKTVQSTLHRFKERRKALSELLDTQKKYLKTMPQQQEDLGGLSRNFMINENIYSYLLQKRAETAIIESSKISTIQIIEPSLTPKKPVKPKRFFMVIVGFMLGLITGVGMALLRAYSITTVQKVEDIEKMTTIPVYGALPVLPTRRSRHLYLEALRVLRTNLEFLHSEKRTKSQRESKLITFTSSVPGEGKTTTISELGKVLAHGNKKTVILDLDLRRSRLHEKFSLDNSAGMSTLLTGQHDFENVLQGTEHKNLHVITSGPIPPNPSELIMSDALNELIVALLEEYDYVLLDTPPIGLVADAMIIMHMSDLNIIVLRANYSKKAYINNVNKFVQQHDLHAGIVLNGMKIESDAGYGYAYGASYGQESGYYGQQDKS